MRPISMEIKRHFEWKTKSEIFHFYINKKYILSQKKYICIDTFKISYKIISINVLSEILIFGIYYVKFLFNSFPWRNNFLSICSLNLIFTLFTRFFYLLSPRVIKYKTICIFFLMTHKPKCGFKSERCEFESLVRSRKCL